MVSETALLKAEDMLKAAGIEPYRFEVRQLAAACENDGELIRLAERRANSEPLQYILGEWEFYGLNFKVGQGVLIPQPDTEILVEQALELIKNIRNPRVLDLCSGSGCVAIAIKSERSDAQVTAVELYDEAFEYLEENIKLNGVKIKTVKADVLKKPEGFSEYDLIVSNPPYIAKSEMAQLESSVLFQPHTALLGGFDGLDFYRAIREYWLPLLKAFGVAAFEIGYTQAGAVSKIFEGFNPQIVKDYSSNERVVKLFKNLV